MTRFLFAACILFACSGCDEYSNVRSTDAQNTVLVSDELPSRMEVVSSTFIGVNLNHHSYGSYAIILRDKKTGSEFVSIISGESPYPNSIVQINTKLTEE